MLGKPYLNTLTFTPRSCTYADTHLGHFRVPDRPQRCKHELKSVQQRATSDAWSAGPSEVVEDVEEISEDGEVYFFHVICPGKKGLPGRMRPCVHFHFTQFVHTRGWAVKLPDGTLRTR